ncbi:hypothetical protein ACIRQP_35560 [Streptomyces sp. NPDC102274]|uniref:hypothetical protein n=1 Tax=Streptomyces sp. NPDC102274 TaxID=3366151 RepID=UPI0037F1DB57
MHKQRTKSRMIAILAALVVAGSSATLATSTAAATDTTAAGASVRAPLPTPVQATVRNNGIGGAYLWKLNPRPEHWGKVFNTERIALECSKTSHHVLYYRLTGQFLVYPKEGAQRLFVRADNVGFATTQERNRINAAEC